MPASFSDAMFDQTSNHILIVNGDRDADVVETQKKWQKRSQTPPQAVFRCLILNPSFV